MDETKAKVSLAKLESTNGLWYNIIKEQIISICKKIEEVG